jgi:hypothetical protein
MISEISSESVTYYVGFEVLTAVVMKSTNFWDIMTCSSLRVNRRFEGTYRLHLHGRRISRALLATCWAYFSTLKIEEPSSSETSVDFQRATGRYIPEDSTFQSYTGR